MEKTLLRIEGIYDHRTFKFLKSLGLSIFSFDFRPLGLNFFPQHRFLDVLNHEYNSSYQFFLHYADEQDFIIQKMLTDLKGYGGNPGTLAPNFFLEFSDNKDLKFYEQFAVPYFWHYQEGGFLKEILQGSYLQGIFFSYNLLEDLFRRGGLYTFINAVLQLFHKTKREKPLEIFLTADWNQNIIPSLTDHLDFHCLSLPINQSIEVCYRNVDLEKLRKNVQSFQKNLGPLG